MIILNTLKRKDFGILILASTIRYIQIWLFNAQIEFNVFIIVVILPNYLQKIVCLNIRGIKLKYPLLVSKGKLTFHGDFLLSK